MESIFITLVALCLVSIRIVLIILWVRDMRKKKKIDLRLYSEQELYNLIAYSVEDNGLHHLDPNYKATCQIIYEEDDEIICEYLEENYIYTDHQIDYLFDMVRKIRENK